MYALFSRQDDGQTVRYRFIEQISLFGCNSGRIPAILKTQVAPSQGEPYPWHISVQDALAANGQIDCALVINLKPKNIVPNLSLYEILDVWGYSSGGWTPIMLRLKELFGNEDPAKSNKDDFQIVETHKLEPIYTFLYLAGSVTGGKLTGKWTAPRASPTNSVILRPDALQYFFRRIHQTSPELLNESPK